MVETHKHKKSLKKVNNVIDMGCFWYTIMNLNKNLAN
jgi:hypothetical protein